MKKLFIAGFLALLVCGQANAGFIQGVTGADMVDVEVVVTYADTSTETAYWTATGAESGGAFGSGFSLSVDGDTFGDFDGVNFYGLFTFSNTSVTPVVGIVINALSAGFVFDPTPGDLAADGSGPGRPFDSSLPATVVYSDPIGELFGTLAITADIDGLSDFLFLTDTDAVSDVPAPAGLALIALALFGMRSASRKVKA